MSKTNLKVPKKRKWVRRKPIEACNYKGPDKGYHWTKPTIRKVVFELCRKYYKENRFSELTYDIMVPKVKEVMPKTKFHPFHVGVYKRQFLIDLDQNLKTPTNKKNVKYKPGKKHRIGRLQHL